MSRHNISHADFWTAGAGIAFNLPEEYQNAIRGMPVFPWTVERFPGGVDDIDGVCEAQQPALGGQHDLILNGAFVDADGVAQMPYCVQILMDHVGADAGRTITCLGTDVNGRPQAAQWAGANAALSGGSKHFSKVDRIFVDDDTAGPVTVGILKVGARGCRMRSVTLPGQSLPLRAGFEIGGGPLDIGFNFSPGTSDDQTATNASPRSFIVPADENQEFWCFYMPDLTKEGVGVNYTDPSQTPSPI